MHKLAQLLKEANLTSGIPLLQNAEQINNNEPKIPRTPKGSSLKLTNGLGKKKPLYVTKRQEKSPYNPS